MRHQVIWISPKGIVITFLVVMTLGFISFMCGVMAGFEQGQFSVASGQVTCVLMPGEFLCEENINAKN